MNDRDRPKPLPARPPATPPQHAPEAAEASEAEPAPGFGEPPRPHIEERDGERAGEPAEQVEVSWRGRTWTARVLGRTGRVDARAAPLMLVGFWESALEAGERPAMEGMVAGGTLADLPEEALQDALARAKPPNITGQRRPFFEDADATRRSGPSSEY